MEIQNKELHRITTTTYISGEVRMDLDSEGDTINFAWVTLEEAKNYDLIGGIWDEIRQVDEILKRRKLS